jgi:hypothetical protein
MIADNTRTGYRCYELEDVLHAAHCNLLVIPVTSARRAVDVVIDERVASILLRRWGIARAESIDFGQLLDDEVDQ